jgi:multiple sugar transport system substrate-binding protein
MDTPQRSATSAGSPVNRRTFMKAAAVVGTAVGIEGVLQARRAPAYAQGTKLHLLRWNDFVPAADEALAKIVIDANKALGAQITLERINANDLQPRITAAVSSGTGPDIIHMLHNWPHLYEKSLVDVSDVAEPLGKAEGGYYEACQAACKVGNVWRAVPHTIVPGQIAYRKSLFEEAGAKEFPKTWQEYREVGKKLKAKGYPIGQTAGHTFGDAPGFWYPMLWSFGGQELARDGKTVVLNSKETLESVKFAVAFWKDACDEGGLAWDDSNNNRAFLAGTIAASLNGASIYVESLRNKDKYKTDKGALMHTDILHGAMPAGPAGRFHYHAGFHHAVMAYSKNQKLAKDLIKFLHKKENYEAWFVPQRGFSVGSTNAWQKHPMWEQDPVMLPYKTAALSFRFFGYAGPPTAKATEVYSKYVIVDLYAKAIQGMKPEDAVKWAETELKKIYA